MGWERLSIHSFLDSIYSTGVSPTDKDRYKYGYDRNSNRQWRQNVVGSGQNLDEYYTYDNLNRLTVMQRGTLTGTPPSGISGTPSAEQDWTLDATGNWNGFVVKAGGTTTLSQTRTQNEVNEITAISASVGTVWADPVYDAAGNMTSMPKPSSLANSYTATYDAWNRMIQVKDGGTTIATYSYDGRNRRIKVDTAVVRHFYFTNSWQDVEERLGSLTTADRQYVWGIRYIDELVCRDRLVGGSSSSSSSSSSGGGGLNERLYACQDANFNVTSLIDTSANVAERYTYDPYGTPTFRNASWADIGGSAKASNILYSGYKFELEIGMFSARNRLLIPPLGIWGRRDPLAIYFENGEPLDYVDDLLRLQINLYQAVIGNPIRHTDPFGLMPWGILGGSVINNSSTCILVWHDPGGYEVFMPGQSSKKTVDYDYVWLNGVWIKIRNGNAVGIGDSIDGVEQVTYTSGIFVVGPHVPDPASNKDKDWWPGRKPTDAVPTLKDCAQLCACRFVTANLTTGVFSVAGAAFSYSLCIKNCTQSSHNPKIPINFTCNDLSPL